MYATNNVDAPKGDGSKEKPFRLDQLDIRYEVLSDGRRKVSIKKPNTVDASEPLIISLTSYGEAGGPPLKFEGYVNSPGDSDSKE